MKKIFLISVIFFILTSAVFAQTKTEVIARAGKQSVAGAGVIRLVFESEDIFIEKTTASISDKQLVVEFPSDFNIVPQKGFDFETFIKDRTLTVNLKESFEMKVFKLSSPARFVIDITPKTAAAEIKPQGEIKPQLEVVIPVMVPQKVFVLDPGHGGYDFGITKNDLKEKDSSLSIVKDIEGFLIKQGKKVFLTRKSDQFMSLKDRAMFTNQKMPEIFISIHVSTSENFAVYISKFADAGTEQSAEAYSLRSRQRGYAQKSKALSENIEKALKETFNANIMHREISFSALNFIGAPAVLIEMPSFKNMNYDQSFRIKLVEAILKGFSYYGQ